MYYNNRKFALSVGKLQLPAPPMFNPRVRRRWLKPLFDGFICAIVIAYYAGIQINIASEVLMVFWQRKMRASLCLCLIAKSIMRWTWHVLITDAVVNCTVRLACLAASVQIEPIPIPRRSRFDQSTIC